MRSNKRYTNTTFTKRVDHEKGLRPVRAGQEPEVCEICGAIYRNRRWTAAGSPLRSEPQKRWQPSRPTICPACEQQHGGIPRGFVHLEGSFLAEHRDEIEHLLRNESDRAADDNPLARIMVWQKEKEDATHLTIATTTEHLAQRLGKTLHKAFSGEVRYKFSHENKFARVWWRRD